MDGVRLTFKTACVNAGAYGEPSAPSGQASKGYLADKSDMHRGKSDRE